MGNISHSPSANICFPQNSLNHTENHTHAINPQKESLAIPSVDYSVSIVSDKKSFVKFCAFCGKQANELRKQRVLKK